VQTLNVLILGGAGFAGSWLVESLLDSGHKVSVLDVVAPSHAGNLKDVLEHVDYCWKSIQDMSPRDLQEREIEVVIDFAAQADVPMGLSSPIWTAQTNLVGLFSVLETLKNCKIQRFIYPGSGTVFGRSFYLPLDELHPLTPANPYSATKAAAEVICLAYHRCYGIPVVVLRNGLVFGPRMRKEIVIAKFLINALLGKPLIVEGGDQTRDPNYVGNVVDAFESVIDASDTVVGEVFHLGGGTEVSIAELARMCVEATASDSPIVRVDYRPGERVMKQAMNINKANRILGYHPKIDLAKGLRLTADWLAKEMQSRPQSIVESEVAQLANGTN